MKFCITLFIGVFIPVGETKVQTDWLREGEKEYKRLSVETRSFPVISAVYPVRDYIESLVGPAY